MYRAVAVFALASLAVGASPEEASFLALQAQVKEAFQKETPVADSSLKAKKSTTKAQKLKKKDSGAQARPLTLVGDWASTQAAMFSQLQAQQQMMQYQQAAMNPSFFFNGYFGQMPPPGSYSFGGLGAPATDDDAADVAALETNLSVGQSRSLPRNGGRLDPDGVDPELGADPYQMARGRRPSALAASSVSDVMKDPYHSQYSGEPVPAVPDLYAGMVNPALHPSSALCDSRISDSCGFQPRLSPNGRPSGNLPRNTFAGDDLRNTEGPEMPSHPLDRAAWGMNNRMMTASSNPLGGVAPGGMYDPLPGPTEPVPLPSYISGARQFNTAAGIYPSTWFGPNLNTPPGVQPPNSFFQPFYEGNGLTSRPPNVPITPDAPLGPAETPSKNGPGLKVTSDAANAAAAKAGSPVPSTGSDSAPAPAAAPAH